MAHDENNAYNDSHVNDMEGTEPDGSEEEIHPLLTTPETPKNISGKNEVTNRFAKLAQRIKTYLPDEGIREGGGNGVVGALYGRLPVETRRKTGWLSLCLFVIVGGFWILDSLKDTVLEESVGLEYQPQAKMLSVLFTLVLVVQYNRVVDFVWKPALFYFVGGCYTGVFTVLGLVLFLTERAEGGGSVSSSTATLFYSHSPAIIGWLSYVAIESYISVTMGLFWAYVNTSVDLEEAKASYGIIIAAAQIGAILGSTTVTFSSKNSMHHPLRVPTLYLIGGLSPALMSCIIWMFERTKLTTTNSLHEREVSANGTRQRQLPAPQAAAATAADMGIIKSFMDGLRLMTSHRYLLLLMGVSCLYEVVLTVLDYEMKVLAVHKYRDGISSLSPRQEGNFTTFMGHFGQTTNFLSFATSFLGTSLIVRSLGLPLAISIFPCLLIVGVLISTALPSLPVLFITMSVLKSLTYSLGEPCKEMLYMVTSDSVKVCLFVRTPIYCYYYYYYYYYYYCADGGLHLLMLPPPPLDLCAIPQFKAKGWIDMFGSRCAKGLGSIITIKFSGEVYHTSTYRR